MVLPPVTEERVSQFVDNPDNARKLLDFESLLPSIKRDGILQPLGATLDGEVLRLMWGHRRFGCAQVLGMETVPTRVFKGPLASGDRERYSLIENVVRLDLLPSEQAAAYQAAITTGKLTATQLAAMIGASDAKVSKKLALLRLAPPLLALIDQGVIAETSAPDLAKRSDVEQRELAASITGTGRMTRGELAKMLGKPIKGGRKAAERMHRLKRGRLSLIYSSDDLDELLAEVEEVRKAIKRAMDENWDFPTLARVLRVSVPA